MLAELIDERPTRDELAELFPSRTPAAVRQRLFHLRRSCGRVTHRESTPKRGDDDFTMLDPSDPGLPDTWSPRWAAAAERSNARFLQALVA